ncbi:MAG: esterase family protein [Saprospiraceae bacterium]|nr:esterase family protein [Saprospiraceae bacterium]
MKEEHFKWYSNNLSMDFEMAVYGHGGYPIIMFPSSMGRYYESKDFGLIESVRWFLDRGIISIYCPDSVDKHSWYNKQVHPARRVKNHIWYDKMVLDEIVHRVRHNTPSGKVAVAGCSFGGYHAANFAFRHCDVVSHLFSMSGAFDIKTFMDGYYDDNVYFNNPLDYLGGLYHPELYKMKIVLGTSEWDICLDANLKLSHLLHSKGIPHWLDMRGWQSHDWALWREMFPHYISLM